MLGTAGLVSTPIIIGVHETQWYKLPRLDLVARAYLLQMAILLAIGAAVLLLPAGRLRAKSIGVAALLVWIYVVAWSLLDTRSGMRDGAAAATVLLCIVIPLLPLRLLSRVLVIAPLAETVGVAAGVVAVVAGTTMYWQESQLEMTPAEMPVAVARPAALRVGSIVPDIYQIILDGLGRPDVLKQRYGVDMSDSVAKLKSLGFEVNSSAGSTAYPETYLSLASMLNMQYLDDLPAWIQGTESRRPMHQMIQNASVIHSLRSAGYEFELIGSGTPVLGSHSYADHCECHYPIIGHLESYLIERSPFRIVPVYRAQHYFHRQHIYRSLASVRAHVSRGRPRIVIAHIMLPHAPFVVDARGRPVSPNRPFRLGEARMWRGTEGEFTAGYGAQAEFVADQIAVIAEDLVKRSRAAGRPSVVIIHGDHGPRRPVYGAEAWYDASEVFPVFLAIRWIEGTSDGERPTASLVNVYRSLFNRYFGAALQPLPERSYLSIGGLYRFRPLTIPRRSQPVGVSLSRE